MSRLLLTIALAFFIVLISCKENSVKSVNNMDIENLADLACRASFLKKERFHLADSIRFYEDSVLNRVQLHPEKMDVWRMKLQKMGKRKLSLIDESRIIADSIGSFLYELTNSMTLEKKKEFNQQLETLKVKKGCN